MWPSTARKLRQRGADVREENYEESPRRFAGPCVLCGRSGVSKRPAPLVVLAVFWPGIRSANLGAATGAGAHEREVEDRMDRYDMEPSAGLHKDLARLQALLR